MLSKKNKNKCDINKICPTHSNVWKPGCKQIKKKNGDTDMLSDWHVMTREDSSANLPSWPGHGAF